MVASNHVTQVAVVGAGGNSGSFITEALLKTGKHKITAITRMNSQSKLPDGVESKKVDYSKPETVVDALKGQEVLVITLSGHTPKETEMVLINAAGEAGVSWILPNEWSPDTANDALVKDVMLFQPKVVARKAIADLGKSSYIAIVTGFWYEWGLAMASGFGIDFANRTVTLFDEGETKMSTSTVPQVGRAVAALLSLPIRPEVPNGQVCLESLKDKVVYINSFTVSQKDMFESACRATGTQKSDWTVTKESSQERYSTGIRELKEGNRTGFPKMMSRLFYPDGSGDFEHNKGTLNILLNLPQEDIDEATRRAIERSRTSH